MEKSWHLDLSIQSLSTGRLFVPIGLLFAQVSKRGRLQVAASTPSAYGKIAAVRFDVSGLMHINWNIRAYIKCRLSDGRTTQA